MLEFLPDGVEVLLFNGNQIPVLDWNLFGIWDEHPKLQVKLLKSYDVRNFLDFLDISLSLSQSRKLSILSYSSMVDPATPPS